MREWMDRWMPPASGVDVRLHQLALHILRSRYGIDWCIWTTLDLFLLPSPPPLPPFPSSFFLFSLLNSLIYLFCYCCYFRLRRDSFRAWPKIPRPSIFIFVSFSFLLLSFPPLLLLFSSPFWRVAKWIYSWNRVSIRASFSSAGGQRHTHTHSHTRREKDI